MAYNQCTVHVQLPLYAMWGVKIMCMATGWTWVWSLVYELHCVKLIQYLQTIPHAGRNRYLHTWLKSAMKNGLPWYQECMFSTALYYASIFRASTPLLSSSIICQDLGVIAIRVKQRLMLSWCDPRQQWVCPRVACMHLVITPIGIHDFNA